MNHIFLRFSNEGMVISKEINDITIIFKDYWMYWWLNILRKVIQLILNFILNLKYSFSKPIQCYLIVELISFNEVKLFTWALIIFVLKIYNYLTYENVVNILNYFPTVLSVI